MKSFYHVGLAPQQRLHSWTDASSSDSRFDEQRTVQRKLLSGPVPGSKALRFDLQIRYAEEAVMLSSYMM